MKLRITAAIVVGLLALLLVNAFLVSRDTRNAESFAAGRVIELDGPDLNVREYGPPGDRAIVLLHGYSASIEWWEQVAQPLASTGHRVVAIDLVGHGGSDAPGDDDDYGAAGQAQAVTRALEALGVRRAVLVGHSMGGHVATAIAEREPHLVERVAVVDTYGDKDLLDRPALAQVGCWPIIGAVLDRFRGVDAMTDSSLQTGFDAGFTVPDLAHRSLEQLTHRGVCKSSAGDDLNDERAAADRLADLGKPVLVVWGATDVLTPTEVNVARYGSAGLPPVVIENSGHSPMIEQPEEFVAALRPFVAAGGA
ncbi:alpha/beta fold hydrolase, partial [Rhodococcus sp. NPDC058514]|uniref:alpha/beta fold hydrolase n=1 Tax=Rhodococcus sp. NPDC058514 TaxID=3346532 RepID=UPI003651A1E1